MKELIENLVTTCSNLVYELETVEKTAASAKRARKITSDLTKLGKEFRAASVAFHKK